MHIWGVVLPQGTNTPKNIADDFTPAEIDAIKLEGLPIFVDHKDRSTADKAYGGVGKILHDWTNSKGQKCIVAEIRGDTVEEKFTQSRIRKGALTDFSLTHLFELKEDKRTKELFQTKTPLEVSVCREGRRNLCHILSWADDSNSTTKSPNIYNSVGVDKLPSENSLPRDYSLKVMASSSSQVPSSPTQERMETPVVQSQEMENVPSSLPVPVDLPMPSQLELLEQFNALKRQNAEFHRENQLYREERERKERAEKEAEQKKQEENNNKIRAEFDSIFETLLQQQGVKKTQEHEQSAAALRGSMDINALDTANKLMSVALTANKMQKEQLEKANATVEQERKQRALQNFYAGANGDFTAHNKFSQPESRFTQLPPVNIPPVAVTPVAQTTPKNNFQDLFFNPSNGSVTTPVVPQQSQRRATPSVDEDGIPIIYPSQSSSPWETKQSVAVSANSSYTFPEASENYDQGIKLSSMIGFRHKTGTGDVTGICHNIRESLKRHADALENHRYSPY